MSKRVQLRVRLAIGNLTSSACENGGEHTLNFITSTNWRCISFESVLECFSPLELSLAVTSTVGIQRRVRGFGVDGEQEGARFGRVVVLDVGNVSFEERLLVLVSRLLNVPVRLSEMRSPMY